MGDGGFRDDGNLVFDDMAVCSRCDIIFLLKCRTERPLVVRQDIVNLFKIQKFSSYKKLILFQAKKCKTDIFI